MKARAQQSAKQRVVAHKQVVEACLSQATAVYLCGEKSAATKLECVLVQAACAQKCVRVKSKAGRRVVKCAAAWKETRKPSPTPPRMST